MNQCERNIRFACFTSSQPSISFIAMSWIVLALLLVGGNSLAGSIDESTQRRQTPSDSLSLGIRATAAGTGEGTLQHLLDSLGYDIDVVNDELGIETFCSPDGFNTATMILEVAGSAVSARSGYYKAGSPSNRYQLFGPTDGPGASVTFTINSSIPTIGFYMEPYLTTPTNRWYSEIAYNTDGFDHVWIFPTGNPKQFILAFEDYVSGGDQDYQDLVIKVILDYVAPTLSGCPSDITINCNQAIPAPATVTAIADCDPSPVVTYAQTTVAGACPQTYRLKRTWTATDKWGGTAQCQQWIDVIDNVAPVLAGCPANVTVECSSIPAAATVTATDNCDATPTVAMTQTTVAGSCAQQYTITRLWTATDDCGNSSWCSQVITVQDTQAPSLTCPATVTVQCATQVPAPNTALVVVSDNCDPSPTVAYVSDVSNGLSCPETITRTYRATDACGNSATCTQQIVIDDTTPPAITCPAPMTVQCLSNVPAPNTALVTATDNCDATPTKTFVSDAQSGTCPTIIIRTYKATDDCGNEATCTQTITVDDTTPPVITCPANTSVLCGAPSDPTHTGYATATDNCTPSGSIVITYSDVVNGVITRTWTATDACGNQSSCTQTISTPPDTTPPVVVNCPDDMTVDCFSNVPSPAPLMVVANDDCDPNPVTSHVSDVQSGSACPYTITRTYRVTDASGNHTDCVQIITIDDNTPPVLVGCPSNETVSCDDIPAPADVTATDNCGSGGLSFNHSLWTGARWHTNVYQGAWFPSVNEDEATFVCSDYDWGQVRTIQNIPFGQSVTLQITPSLQSGGVNFDGAFLGFGDGWMLYQGDFAGVEFKYGQVNIIQKRSSYGAHEVLAAIGSYTPGQTYTITLNIDASSVVHVSGDFVGSAAAVAIPTNHRFIMAVANSPDGFSASLVSAVNLVEVTSAGACAQAKTITRTWTATDFCGNTATCSQIITVIDNTAPVITTSPGPIAVQCSANVPSPNTSLVAATDNCDPAPAISFVGDVSNGLSCPETITRTYKAQDACGNAALVTQLITVDDTTPPSLTCPAPVTVQCMTQVPTPNPALCSSTDNCDATPTITFVSDVQNGSGCPLTITRTYKATDDCGNEATCTQVITVNDQTPPTISCPAPVTVQCMTQVPTPNPALCTASDNCDPTPTITFVSDSQSGSGCPLTITRTYRATDDCGNQATCTQLITVDDTTAPLITCPAPVTVNCLTDVPAANPSLCTATDNCDPTPTITFVNDVQNGSGCPLTITRTYKATDDCGNEAICTQTITVNDQVAPQITCPAPVTVQCASLVPSPNTALCTATDNCDPNPVIAFVNDVSNGQTCPEIITRTYKATDDCGNVAYCAQIITIDDTTAPLLTCPSAVTVQCMGNVPAPNPAACAVSDNCDATPTVAFVGDVQSGSGCPLTITRTYKATDDCGNEAFCTQTITVNDQTAPQITCPAPVTVQCVSMVPVPNTALVTATDNCDPTPTVVWVNDNSSGTCPTTITRTYQATDDCGNQATCQQIITVNDNIPPVLAGCPANVEVSCDNVPAPAAVTATDNCSTPTISMAETSSPGACAQSYLIFRVWTATDACGNAVQCQQVITVRDQTAPQMACPENIMVNCLSDAPAPNPSAVVVTDNCDPIPTVTFVSDVQEGTGCPMYVMRTYRAVDHCGNQATCVQMITVDDQELPQLVGCPANVALPCGSALPPVATVTATDNCGPATVTFNEVTTPGSCSYSYTVTRSWTAIDVCGNQNTCQQVITVTDNVAPQMTCPAAVAVECVVDIPSPNPASVTVTDNCDPSPVVSFVSDVRGTQTCPTQITRTYRAVDVCGNEAFCTQIITLDDNTAPVFTSFPADQDIIQCQPTQICLPIVATDNCLGSVVLSITSGPGAIVGGQWCVTPTVSTSYDVTIRAADTCGNFVDDTFHVGLQINSAPVLTNCPSSAQVHWGQTYTYDLNATDPDADDLTFSLCAGAPEGASINPSTGVLQFVATAQDICDPALCVIVKDECNAADTCSFNVCVNNDPPVITCPENQVLCYGYSLETQVTATDPDGGPYKFFYLISGPTGLQVNANTGAVTWPNPTPGRHDVCVLVTDSAATCSPCSPSNADTCCFDVNVVSLDLVIEKVEDQLQGQYTKVSIDFKNQGTNWPIAGYDLLIQYDASGLAFQKASEGEFFTDCEWEYFSYRFGANGNCGGSACPSGLVRIVALAETTGGNMANHPDCYTNDGIAYPGPGSTTATELTELTFLVTNDRTLECQYLPIRFAWYDCGDNALSNVRGDTVYISHLVYDYAGAIGDPLEPLWSEITGLDNTMPTVTGAPSPECNTSFKYEMVRCANFYNGGVDVICADSIDAPADINLNGVEYEIADAVMFTNYFVSGLVAFGVHAEGSIAASDVNKDGVTLSVSDLVYLIRVIVGDAQQYVKEGVVTPVAAGYSVDDGVVSVTGDVDISGAALVVRGNVTPELLATDMDMTFAYDGAVTRIIVTSPLEASSMYSFQGAFIKGIHGSIISIELATSEGVPVMAQNVPSRYSLGQNYPNPFNPITSIEFALPEAAAYRLTIYNIEGRVVDEFVGQSDAPGVVKVDWNAGDRASGVYLYRLDAGEFSQTRKMLLLK